MEPLTNKTTNNNDKDNISNNNNIKSKINDNDNLYNNFNIKLKQIKFKLKLHKDLVFCSTILKDGRFATGSKDSTINIYNMKTFNLDFTIKEHSKGVSRLIQLSSGLLASCSVDNTIKLFNINNNNYKVEQTLKDHEDSVDCMIELSDKRLVSGSSNIIFYIYNYNKYTKDYQLKPNYPCFNMTQTKESELCYNEYVNDGNDSIYFYDLIKRKIRGKIKFDHCLPFLKMITKDLLIIGGEDILSIINVNKYIVVRTINAPNSCYIYCCCMLNKNMFLTGDDNGNLKQWKIEGDNLKLISTKEKAHDKAIMTILRLRDGHILSGSKGDMIIW